MNYLYLTLVGTFYSCYINIFYQIVTRDKLTDSNKFLLQNLTFSQSVNKFPNFWNQHVYWHVREILPLVLVTCKISPFHTLPHFFPVLTFAYPNPLCLYLSSCVLSNINISSYVLVSPRI